MSTKEQYIGLFLGTAVGDAVGLPREGLSSKRAKKLFGNKIRPALIVIPYIKRLTICSDDTEHLWITAQALLETQLQGTNAFEKRLSQLMKKWVLTFPVGAGMATLKACLKLLLGVSPKKSGVFSAGNGAAMRAPIIGAFYADDIHKMETVLKISTSMTHTDPKAYEGAWVVAKAAALLINDNPQEAPIEQFFNIIMPNIKGEELYNYLLFAKKHLEKGCSLSEYLEALSLDKKGISGYINHTVPAIIYAWLHYFHDYQETTTQLIQVGGDTDTTAAIAGALAGITTGKEGVPTDWLKSILNNPITINKLEQLAQVLAVNDQQPLPKISFILLGVRNILLFLIVLLHGFRRMLPPY